jgi:hypothetical protein
MRARCHDSTPPAVRGPCRPRGLAGVAGMADTAGTAGIAGIDFGQVQQQQGQEQQQQHESCVVAPPALPAGAWYWDGLGGM